MFEVKATWRGGFKFQGTDGDGREVKMDASVGAGGEGDGYRPAELPLLGLAGCSGIDTVEILQKMRQPVEGLDVRVTAEKKSDGPAGFASVKIYYTVRGKGLDPAKVEKAITMSEDKYCTVGGALRDPTSITHEITIEE